ncbi:MAG: nucleotidyl transferase AbiEii/AbiGii toxin family protein [Nitrospirota bacterium]
MGFLRELSFYLAGGTGLALQLGHRKSLDLDFFTPRDFSPEQISALIKSQNIHTSGEIRSRGTLHCIIEGIKASFIYYDGLLQFPLLEFNSLNIADWRDIAAEKLRIVADRGQKKDFYDLYFSVQHLGVETLVGLAVRKFARNVNYFHLLKGLTFFEDAEKNPDPMSIDKSMTWEKVKQFFSDHVGDFEKAFENAVV